MYVWSVRSTAATFAVRAACALAISSALVLPLPSPAAGSSVAQAACSATVGPGIPAPTAIASGIDGFHATWYGQSGYPTLCPGGRSTAVVAFYNSGTRGWVSGRTGEMAFLGTWSPVPGQDRPSILGGDGTHGSPDTGWPRYDRLAAQPATYIGPGQVAWFQFTIQAPQIPGTYRLALRPLVEGTAWMEDFGVFWQVTVVPDAAAISVTPPTAVALSQGATRVYVLQVAGAILGGCVDLAIVDAATYPADGTFRDAEPDAAGRTTGNGRADFSRAAVFNTVNGSGASTSFVECVPIPPSRRIEVTITSLAKNAYVRPIAFFDLDGDGALDLDAAKRPIEIVGVGGATRFVIPQNSFDPESSGYPFSFG